MLVKHGLTFKTQVRYSDSGSTVRFIDPIGHIYCLYDPSRECLTLSSGPKVREIVGDS